MTKSEIYKDRNELSKKLVQIQILLQECYELSDNFQYIWYQKEFKEMAKDNYQYMKEIKEDVEKELAQ